MAGALIQIVGENRNSLIRREFGLLCGIKKEMEKLSSLLSTIQAVLKDAEEKQMKDKVLRNWLLKLNATTYEVDNILDDCTIEAAKLQNKDQTFIKCLVNPVGNILFRIGVKVMKSMRKDQSCPNRVPLEGIREGEDIEMFIDRTSGCEDVSVLPILGMGGLGKTNLEGKQDLRRHGFLRKILVV